MKQRYDFSRGVRGKFYEPGAAFKRPVYLDAEMEGYLAKRAQAKGVELDELVNQLLKREIESIEGGE
jgi:hypothetical protein